MLGTPDPHSFHRSRTTTQRRDSVLTEMPKVRDLSGDPAFRFELALAHRGSSNCQFVPRGIVPRQLQMPAPTEEGVDELALPDDVSPRPHRLRSDCLASVSRTCSR